MHINKIYVQGVIGYAILKNKENKIMLLSDMHDVKEKCGDEFISDWLKKQKKIKLLLEEVPPSDVNLKELWHGSEHTKKLRNLYLNNIDKIIGLDIRGELLKFSWELINVMFFPPISLKDYLIYCEQFFTFKHIFFLNNISEIYNENILNDRENLISKQFEYCFNEYKKILEKYSMFMDTTVQILFEDNRIIFEEISSLLNDIMELYTIMQLYKWKIYNVNKFIIHKGLFHTSNLLKWLINLYNFEIIEMDGLTYFENVDTVKHNGCLNIPNEFN